MSAARPAGARPAAFLDRDGVLNVDRGFVHRPEDIEWVAGAMEAVRLLNRSGHLVFVVTNQAGVARGLYECAAVERLHDWMAARLAEADARIDAFYYCPHHPSEGAGAWTMACDCRKPQPGMLRRAMREFAVDPARSFLIGDRDTDLEAAARAGIRGVRFAGGDLADAVRAALSRRAS